MSTGRTDGWERPLGVWEQMVELAAPASPGEPLRLQGSIAAVRLIKEWYLDAEDDVSARDCRDYEKRLLADLNGYRR